MSEFKIKDPEKIEFTLTFTMPLSDWKLLAKQFKANAGGYVEWPASQFTSDISSMTSQATQKFYPEAEEDSDV